MESEDGNEQGAKSGEQEKKVSLHSSRYVFITFTDFEKVLFYNGLFDV